MLSLNLDWNKFSKEKYEGVLKKPYYDYVGAVHVGDISIDLSCREEGTLSFDFYVLHEDTGYGYTDNNTPYDHADGFDVSLDGMSYEEFQSKAKEMIKEYVAGYTGAYSLIEHANKPLASWD